MNATTIDRTAALLTHGPDKAITLALSLAQAERAIHAFSAGQVDAIVEADGQTYLLRPAQTHLRQEASRLRAILDSAPDGILVLNRAGIIVAQYGAAGGMAAVDRQDLIGRSIFTLIHDEDLTKLYTVFFNIAEGLRATAAVQFRRRDGSGGWHFVEATAARSHGGDSDQVLLSVRPLPGARPIFDERPRLRVPAAPSVAPARDRFLSMLSHELRTPLTPVLLGIAELQEDERFAEARPVLAMIRRNVDLQARLLDELMEFTLVGQHKVRLLLEPLDAAVHIGYVVEICQSELTEAGITVLLGFKEGAPIMVCADSVRLQQVMWNLLKNAIKFSPPGSCITIATSEGPGHHLTIDFTDQGVGIEPDLLGRVFEAFQQGSVAQQRAKGGLGLGLFIAKGLAEAQAGQLTVDSPGSGLGSTFRLILPKPPADGTCLPIESSSLFSAAALRPAGA